MIKVLHVDDEPSFLELVSFFLNREGDFEIVTAVTAQDAMQKLREHEFDAIVADYSLPGMSGIDLLKILRAQGNDIPFILLTGKGREEVAAEALSSGADLYLQKGTNPKLQFATLAHVLRQSVRRRRSEIETREAERSLADVFNSIQDGITVLDNDFNILRTNPTTERWYAHKAPLVGKKCYDAYQDRHDVCPNCPNRETLRSGKASNEVVPKVGPKGEIIGWLDLFNFPIIDNKTGELTGVIEYARDITKRRKAEQSLIDALERYKELEATIDRSSVVVIHWPPDPQAPETFMSNSIRQFGYSREDFNSGRVVFEDIIHPDDRARVRDEVAEYIKSGADELDEEYRIVSKSNEIYWVADHTYARRGPDGKPIQYESLLIDVTSSKLVQDRLEELTSRLQAIVEAFPDLHFILRPDGTILEHKTSQDRDLYVPPTEFIGKRMQDVLPPEVGEIYEQMFAEVMRDGAAKAREYSLEMEGEKRFYEGRLMPMSKDKLLLVVRNITDRKGAEEALRASEKKYKQLVDLAQEGIMMTDADAVIRFANPRMVDMLGYRADEMVGKPVFQFMNEQASELAVRKFEDRRKREFTDRYELDFLRKDGSLVRTSLGVTPLKDKEGGFSGSLAVITDVTDRKRYEEALEVANQKLNLMGHVTRHDSLNQLSVLMGWLEILQETVTEAPASEHLAAAQKAALAIQKELEFTADYESAGAESPNWMDLDRACKQGIPDLIAEGIVVTISLDGVEIIADQMLDKVFRNLADNSVRHGKHVTKIRVRYEESKDGLTVIYEDDGVGIAQADKGTLFQQGEGERTAHGLHFVKGILGITCIAIREAGTPGKGARFELFVTPGNYRIVR